MSVLVPGLALLVNKSSSSRGRVINDGTTTYGKHGYPPPAPPRARPLLMMFPLKPIGSPGYPRDDERVKTFMLAKANAHGNLADHEMEVLSVLCCG